MKTIKIIDLFNKIVNGEEVPLRIKWDGDTWKFKEQFNDYLNETEEEKEYLFYTGFDNYADAKRFLNCEVEIIEEEQEEKIKKIGPSFKANYLNNDLQKQIRTVQSNCALAFVKIDELIDTVNELKNKED